MSDVKTKYEVAGDITIALIEKMPPGQWPEAAATQVAEAYKTIYAAVLAPKEPEKG